MEPTTVGSLWLENDLHENELEFESHMGRSKKNVRVTSPGGVLTIFWVTGRLGPFDPPFSTYVEFWPLLLGSDVEYWPPFFQAS